MLFLSILVFLVTGALSETPIHYDISIVPDFSNLNFSSVVTITYQVNEPIQTFTLDAKNLEVIDVKVKSTKSGSEIDVSNFGTDPESETLVIEVGTQLEENSYEVQISYSGKINENLEGFYVSSYTNILEVEERNFYLADFRYYKARQVFPCKDDATHDAAYTLSIVRPNDYISVTSSPLQESQPYDDNRSKDIFTRTDSFPTYLLSFAIIYFDSRTYDGTTIYSVEDTEGIDFMGELTSELVSSYSYLGLKPVTQVLVPDYSLSTDVLDNVGLIIYKQSLVLFIEDIESLDEKQETAKLVTHAVLSQKLKSTDFQWWPNYWVTEGTIGCQQYEALEKILPEWRLSEQFVTEELSNTLDFDSEDNEFSLLLTENDTPDSFSKFHSAKAFTLVKMLIEPPFAGNGFDDPNSPETLSWTQKKGHPLVTATRTKRGNEFTFSQNEETPRTVPVSVYFQSQDNNDKNTFFYFVFDESSYPINVTEYILDSWFIVNGNRIGYYRTNYDTNWRSITNFLSDRSNDISQIPPVFKAVLIEDAFYSAQVDSLSFDDFLDLTLFLPRETDYLPYFSFIKVADRIRSLLAFTNVQGHFMKYAISLVESLYYRIGIIPRTTENHMTKIARIKILTWLCNFGYEKCQTDAGSIISVSPYPQPDLQEVLYCGIMRRGSFETYDFLKTEYDVYGKKRILRSMGCTSDMQMLYVYITSTLYPDGSYFKKEDRADAFLAAMNSDDKGVEVALGVLQYNLSLFINSFSYDNAERIIIALAKKLTTEDQKTRISVQFAHLDKDQAEKYANVFVTARNIIQKNIDWQKANLDTFRTWLNANFPEASTTTEETSNGTTTTPRTTTTTTERPNGATDIKVSVFSSFFCLMLCFTVAQMQKESILKIVT